MLRPGALIFATAALFAVSCDGSEDTFRAPDDVGKAEILPVVMTTQLAVGENRFAFQLLDEDSQNVPNAEVRLRTAPLDGGEGEFGEAREASYIVLELEALQTVVEHEHADGSVHTHSAPYGSGLYTATVEFAQAGQWGIEFDIEYRGDEITVPLVVSVLEDAEYPGVGDPAPATENYTLRNRPIEELSSDPNPDPELYNHTVRQAIESGDTFVVAFATPAFCHSRVCAPVLEAVKEVKADLPEAVYIHIEPFENLLDPQSLRDSPVVAEWRLPNEPWVFVVDGEGIVTAAFEGPFAVDELKEAVSAALGT